MILIYLAEKYTWEYMFSIQRLKLTQVYMFFQALLVFSYISLSTFTCL